MPSPPRLSLPAAALLALAIAAPSGAVPVPVDGVAPASAAPAPMIAPLDLPAPVKFGDRVISAASKFKGTPYRYGGTTPRGFDCSGYTRYVYGKLHKKLPRTSQQQFKRAHRVTHPQIGDLIFYHHGRGGPVYHVGIYAGPGRVWHAPHPGDRVRNGKIYASHWTAGRY